MPHLLSSLTANLLMKNLEGTSSPGSAGDVQIENVPESPCRDGAACPQAGYERG